MNRATWVIRGWQGEAIEDFWSCGTVGVGVWTGEAALPEVSRPELRTIILFSYPGECRLDNLVHIIIARFWRIAGNEASFLACLVPNQRHCLKVRNALSTR